MRNLQNIFDETMKMTLNDLHSNLEAGSDKLTASELDKMLKDLTKIKYQITIVRNLVKKYELVEAGKFPVWKQINK